MPSGRRYPVPAGAGRPKFPPVQDEVDDVTPLPQVRGGFLENRPGEGRNEVIAAPAVANPRPFPVLVDLDLSATVWVSKNILVAGLEKVVNDRLFGGQLTLELEKRHAPLLKKVCITD
jgi:hypothetical protein